MDEIMGRTEIGIGQENTEMNCTHCGKTRPPNKLKQAGGWWYLSDYYGLSGTWCATCYKKISHDAYGNPNHPKNYRTILTHHRSNQ